MALSRHPGSLSGPVPICSGKRPELRHTFHSPHPPMVSPTAVHFELGPRSLDPAAVFAARLPSLFEARCRLTTSATTYDVRATKPIRLSFSSQGRRPRSPSFSLRTTPPIAGQWHAASRAPSASPTPVLVRPVTRFTQPRCLRERPTTAEFPRRCIVRIDVHGSKDRAKDASRVRMRRCPVPASGAYAYRAQADVVPLLGLPSDIRCHRRVRPPRRKPR